MSLLEQVRRAFRWSPRRLDAPIALPHEDAPKLPENKEPKTHRVDRGVISRLAAGEVEFGLLLHRTIAGQDERGNVVISPMSIGLALAMASTGARGETRDEMARLLGIEGVDSPMVNEGYATLLRAFGRRTSGVLLRICNSIWADMDFPIRPEFAESCTKFLDAEVANVSFRAADTVDRINCWVSERTAGKIDRIVDDIGDLTVLVLLNATYFHGNWFASFDPSATRELVFHAVSGARKHPMMHQDGTYPYLETDEFQAVALSYSDHRTALYLFLPKENSSLREFVQRIDSALWAQWMAGFSDRRGTIAAPRFRARFEAELNGDLKRLGIETAFIPGRADFSGMLADGIQTGIGRVVHKTILDFDETGTEAASVTGAWVILGMREEFSPPPPFRMEVDRPFFLAIRDNVTGLLLFTASVVEP